MFWLNIKDITRLLLIPAHPKTQSEIYNGPCGLQHAYTCSECTATCPLCDDHTFKTLTRDTCVFYRRRTPPSSGFRKCSRSFLPRLF